MLRSFNLKANVCHSPPDDEPLGLLELDENLDDAERPAELPAGVYTGEVQDVQVQTSGKGNQYYQVRFVIPPESIPADVRDSFPDGASLFWNRQIVPKAKDRRAIWNLKQFMTALGLSTSTNQIDPNEWMGCSARLRIVMGKWQGEDRAEIRQIEPAEASATRRAPPRAVPTPARKAAPARRASR